MLSLLPTIHDGLRIYDGVRLFTVHSIGGIPSIMTSFVIGAASASPNPECNDQFVKTLVGGLGTIINILMALGIAIAVIGIIVGGLMRATAWGSEQRIAMSNKAITCAVIGLIIVLLGVTLGGQIPTWFQAGGSCTVS